jgi:hypothetical protein
VRLTSLALALTHAAGLDPCRTFAPLAFVPEPYASALQATRCAPVERPLREAPEPFRPTKARCSTHQSSPHAAAIAGTGAMRLSGQQKHQLEVGLSLPNSIPDPSHKTGGCRTSFWHK